MGFCGAWCGCSAVHTEAKCFFVSESDLEPLVTESSSRLYHPRYHLGDIVSPSPPTLFLRHLRCFSVASDSSPPPTSYRVIPLHYMSIAHVVHYYIELYGLPALDARTTCSRIPPQAPKQQLSASCRCVATYLSDYSSPHHRLRDTLLYAARWLTPVRTTSRFASPLIPPGPGPSRLTRDGMSQTSKNTATLTSSMQGSVPQLSPPSPLVPASARPFEGARPATTRSR